MSRTLQFVLICFLLAAGGSNAHTRSESYSNWQRSESALTASLTVPLREVMTLYNGADATIPPRELLQDHAAEMISVVSSTGACQQADATILQAPSGFVRVELSFDCAPGKPQAVEFGAMFEAAPAHVNYARLYENGSSLGENLFTRSSKRWQIGNLSESPGNTVQTFTAFLQIGIEHIAGGVDHIAFLLGLLLVAGTLGRSIVAVTGFTLGHSVSLGAAVVGYVGADSQLVEVFIGFTVMLVAVEYFLLRRPDVRAFAPLCLGLAWLTGLLAVAGANLAPRVLFAYGGFGVFAAVYLLLARHMNSESNSKLATALLFAATCSFGLVHGFGFAGFLMETGLLGTSLLLPLLGFNVGVEIGQLALVAVAMLAALLLRNRVPQALPAVLAGALAGIGIFWFVERTFA